MYRPVLVTPAAIKPVTLDEVKAHRHIDHEDDDGLLGGLIAAATGYLDGWSGILKRCLCEQTWRQDFDRFLWDQNFESCFIRGMRLALFPVLSIDSVKYLDFAGIERTVDPANYSIQTDDRGSYVQFLQTFAAPATWRERPTVTITAKYGYANKPGVGDAPSTSTVPDELKTAILFLVGHWYEHREAVVGLDSRVTPTVLPLALDALVAPFRRVMP